MSHGPALGSVTIICYVSGTVGDDGIQGIDPNTGDSTVLVPSGIVRALGIAATQSNIWTGFNAIGDGSCTLDKRDASGQIVKSFTTPSYEIGPIASESEDIWLFLNGNQFLYKIAGSI